MSPPDHLSSLGVASEDSTGDEAFAMCKIAKPHQPQKGEYVYVSI